MVGCIPARPGGTQMGIEAMAAPSGPTSKANGIGPEMGLSLLLSCVATIEPCKWASGLGWTTMNVPPTVTPWPPVPDVTVSWVAAAVAVTDPAPSVHLRDAVVSAATSAPWCVPGLNQTGWPAAGKTGPAAVASPLLGPYGTLRFWVP